MQFFGPLICCLILYLSGVTEATIFTDCGSKNVTVSTVSIIPCDGDPCPLVKGTNSTIVIEFSAHKDIEPGDFRVLKTNVDGEFEVYALPPSDMCNHLTPACPIRAGRNYTYSFTDQVMMFFRQGLLDARWVLLDAKNETFVCVEFPLDIKGPEN
ncbi:Niemann-Pick C2 protein [Clonorchis sinensis]|uniref:Niemann-Pick C2 protein n=1 Tax=Clonorchis sinensis TaxID=79923 RepID=G7YWU8_CLOSI|nr:Niemann-Pick C2 protein [Clonorchis sinensis]